MSRLAQGKESLLEHPEVNGGFTSSMLTIHASRTWLIDLSNHLPEAQLDGLDITLKTLPPKGWIPPNVNFREWNVREPVPEDLVGQYDIVHVRYLCLVLSNDEVSSVLENVTKLLSECCQYHPRLFVRLWMWHP